MKPKEKKPIPNSLPKEHYLPDNIRQRAQNLMNSLVPVANALKNWMPEPDALKLIHELQVYQIELEMQISELLLANMEEKSMSAQYEELYDFSKAGYFEFSAENKLVDLDNPASQQLSNNTLVLKNKHFVFFVSMTSNPVSTIFFMKLLRARRRKSMIYRPLGITEFPGILS